MASSILVCGCPDLTLTPTLPLTPSERPVRVRVRVGVRVRSGHAHTPRRAKSRAADRALYPEPGRGGMGARYRRRASAPPAEGEDEAHGAPDAEEPGSARERGRLLPVAEGGQLRQRPLP